MPRRAIILAASAALLFVGCGDETPSEVDAGADAGPVVVFDDAGIDAGAPVDAGPGPTDASRPDAAAVMDGGLDAGPDDDGGGLDGGFDGGSDGGFDAGPFDAGVPMSVVFPPRDHRCVASASRPCATTEPLRSEMDRTIDVSRDMPPRTYTYLVRSWSAPEVTFAGNAAGFNLDGMDSGAGSAAVDATCEEFNEDFTTLRDPGHEGVDNAFAGLIPTVEGLLDASTCPGMVTAGCIDAQFAEAIAAGDFLYLIEVSGVDSLTYDEDVSVALYLGSVPGGGAPALEPDGTPSPGQTFDTLTMLVAPTAGDIFDGRLRVRWTASVDLPALGMALLPLRLDDPELRADITATGLGLGVVGATSDVDYLVTQAELIMPGIGATVRSVLESVADVSPSAADPAVCDELSSGYFFDAVPAVRR